MTDTLESQKIILRTAIRSQLLAMPDSQSEIASAQLSTQLRALPVLRDRKHLLAFHPHKHEISPLEHLREWLDGGRALSFPRVEDDAITICPYQIHNFAYLKPGYRHIMEPDASACAIAPLESIDAILVPALALDKQGHRLGQGGGHYDRLLARLPISCVTIGLAYDWQVIDSVPAVEHDQSLQWIVTPARIIDCSA